MFFRRKAQEIHRPAIKKVNELINVKSHKQKKYISLMLVPSYSAGKTRSLRVPRALFYGVVIGVFLISAALTGFYLRSSHFQRMANDLSESLDETQGAFYEFQQMSEQIQSDLMDTTIQIYGQLSDEQMRAQEELNRQARRHQYALEDIWKYVEEIEAAIGELDRERQEIFDSLSARSIIPPVANLLSQLEESQKELLANAANGGFRLLNTNETLVDGPEPDDANTSAASHAFGLMAMGGPAPLSGDELLVRLDILANELSLQRQLLDNLDSYRRRMDSYLRNYPTLWPVRGSISSGFGWRSNPFGRGSEHHNGVDIPAGTGTAIRAAGGGTIIYSGWRNGYGNVVEIDHGGGIITKYAHNTRNSAQVGQRVERGDIIAYVGSTGRSTGPHLHYEVQVNGHTVNPVPFLLEHH